MENATQTTDKPAVPSQVTPATPVPAAKPKRALKGKVGVVATVAIEEWKPATLPFEGKAPKGLIIRKLGEVTGKDKQGNDKHSKSMVLATPTVAKVQEQNPGMSRIDADREVEAIGTAIKPAVMGRVVAAGSHRSFIVRRYSETPGKRDKISVTLERIRVGDELELLAKKYGKSVKYVKKMLGIADAPEVAV